MNCKTLLRLYYLLIAVVIALAAGIMFYLSFNQDELVGLDQETHTMEAVADLQLAFQQVIMPPNDYLITGDKGEREHFQELFTGVGQRLDEVNSSLAKNSEAQSLLNDLDAHVKEIKVSAEAILALDNPIGNQVGMNLMEDMDQKADTVTEELEALHELSREALNQSLERTSNVAQKFQFVLLIVCVLAIVIGLLEGYYFKKIIFVPIEQMTKLAHTLAAGDLTVEFEQKVSGEVGALSKVFAETVKSLAGLTKQVRTISDSVLNSTEQVSANASNCAKASEQIAIAMQEIATGSSGEFEELKHVSGAVTNLDRIVTDMVCKANDQANIVSSAASQLNNLNDSVEGIAQNSEQLATVAQEMLEAATTGGQVVEETVKGMGHIRAKVLYSSEKMEKLSKESERINEIIQVIEEIAEQTNLLALNAAIEAARAGEMGKGFAVVADEVRKLAERSAKATKEVTNLINVIKADTVTAQHAMEEGTTEVEKGSKLANQAGTAMARIVDIVKDTATSVQAIQSEIQHVATGTQVVAQQMSDLASVVDNFSSATEQMAGESHGINSSTTKMADLSEVRAANSQEVSASTEQVTASVEQIAANGAMLFDLANQLSNAVKRFKV